MADEPAEPPPPAAAPPVAPAAVDDVPTEEKEGIKRILSDFGRGTKDLLRFVFVEQRAERRKELVESLRFYVTYK